ncbi:MAG: T9SS type A sorting domain-containing protein, partial [Bacteroidales bacterium]|nr:T9SS type A sorting domain-containing protein [Bacteroidales bacterium]
GGVAYGGGSYYWGDTAHIGIYLYDSVIFERWSNADFVQVSSQPEYTYPVTHTEIFTASVDASKLKDKDVDPPIEDTTVSGKNIRVYPNPLMDGQELNILSDKENLQSIRLFSTAGKHILYRKFSEDGVKSVRLRLPHLEAGCYFYEIGLTGDSRKIGKLIKL